MASFEQAFGTNLALKLPAIASVLNTSELDKDASGLRFLLLATASLDPNTLVPALGELCAHQALPPPGSPALLQHHMGEGSDRAKEWLASHSFLLPTSQEE